MEDKVPVFLKRNARKTIWKSVNRRNYRWI